MSSTAFRFVLSIALLMWALVMFPLGAAIVCYELDWRLLLGVDPTLAVTLLSTAMFTIGWFLIWRSEVSWNRRRRIGTVVLVALNTLAATGIGIFFALVLTETELGYFFAGLVWWFLWLVGTAMLWRETKLERVLTTS